MKFFATASTLIAAVSGQWLAPYAAVGLKSAPCVNAANFPVPCAAGLAAPVWYGKRDAEADPQVLVAGVPFGSSTGLDPITQGLDAATQGYAPYAYAAPYGGLVYGKREAEADPQLIAAAPYVGYAGYAVAAPHAVAAVPGGLVHSSLVGVCTNVAGAQVPC